MNHKRCIIDGTGRVNWKREQKKKKFCSLNIEEIMLGISRPIRMSMYERCTFENLQELYHQLEVFITIPKVTLGSFILHESAKSEKKDSP